MEGVVPNVPILTDTGHNNSKMRRDKNHMEKDSKAEFWHYPKFSEQGYT